MESDKKIKIDDMGTLRYLVVTGQRNCGLYCKKTPVIHFYAICKPDRLAFCFSLKMGGDYEAINFRLKGLKRVMCVALA